MHIFKLPVQCNRLCVKGCGCVQVQAITARLLALRTLLGKHDDIDIIWMLERAPR